MNIKKITSILLAASMLVGAAGCSKPNNGSQQTSGSKKTVELTLWHAMGGVNGEAVKYIVDEFNKKQTDIHVTAQFQGTYDDAINKLKSSMTGKAGPDIAQIYDIGSRYMVDSGWVVPMQKFIDEDKKFSKDDIEPTLLGYYTVDNKLQSMPFNSSTPILYYNKTAFKAAGLDPNKPPKNFQEIAEYSQKLVKKDGSGKVSQYGFSMAIYGWFFEQLLAKQGAMYANNANGRTQKATAVEWDKSEAGMNILKEWKKLVDSGSVGNFGRKTDDTKNAFTAGRTAMILESTAALGGLVKGAGDRFEIGTAYLPALGTENPNGGVIIGGGSLYALNNGDETRQKAAWEFIKFAVSPEQQATWSKTTGYFPVNKKAYDLDVMKKHLETAPQFKTAIDQLHNTKVNEATRGGLIGVFPEARATIETEIENMLQNKQTPEQAIQNAAKKVNDAITNYNKTNTK
ncbi:ABC transporter substrate-binding protein [Clostridium swellfunianum]|uniref:ABC transporter substrate-binding protein n=1 Tax=Clostridium swellfunianum TaxID=1367462 RepID=UPI00202EA388|nr:ABC transporter substrate-binding protein [Clostridium swellfunianum]MCM0650815.1 ABC transporter substrate-binding protein [Clostridium swellfunianum]